MVQQIKKVYVSGKITGDANWKAKFAEAEQKLKALGYTVLTPALIDVEIDYEDYMYIDFAMLSVCDAIYMLPDWTDSAGANREYNYAKALGKEILNEYEIV